jgi:hypothetical protein
MCFGYLRGANSISTVAVPFHAGASLSDVCPHAVEGNLDAYAVNKGHGKRNAPRSMCCLFYALIILPETFRTESYVRLGWHGQFRTIVTNISPEALSSHVLHPRVSKGDCVTLLLVLIER